MDFGDLEVSWQGPIGARPFGAPWSKETPGLGQGAEAVSAVIRISVVVIIIIILDNRNFSSLSR